MDQPIHSVSVPTSGLNQHSDLTATEYPADAVVSERRSSRAPLVAPFVGRKEQFAQLSEALNGGASAARIVCVHGERGIGRTRFVQEFLQRLRTETSPLLLQPKPGDCTELTALLRSIAVQLPAGGSFITRALSRGLERQGFEESAARLLVNSLFQEVYQCATDRRSCIRPLQKRVVIVLDDFETAPIALQRWLAETLLPQLHGLTNYLDYVIVTLSTAPLSSKLDPVAWSALPHRLFELQIPRLSKEDSIQLITSFARRTDEALVCYELGEGVPAAMLGLLRHSLRPTAEINAALRQCAPAEAELLVAVATLGLATPEGLRLALGAEAATPWIRQNAPAGLVVPFVGSWRGEGVQLPAPIARLVEQQLKPRHAGVAHRAAEAATTISALTGLFPTDLARRRAAQLSVFRFFDAAAIRTCFEAAAPAMLDFIRLHERAFVPTTGERWRVSDEISGHLKRYASALGDLDLGTLRKRVGVAWQEREVSLRQAQEESAAAIKKLDEDRERIFKDIGQARAAVIAAERDCHEARTSRLSSDAWRLGASLLINGAGVGCLWAALFMQAQRTSFVILGVLLILLGLCTPAFSRRNGRAEHETRRANAEAQSKLERAQGTLEFTETRYAAVQRRLAEERRKAEEARAALLEPFPS